MIRINLLPQDSKKRRRRRGPAPSIQGTGLLAVFGIAILLEVGGLMWWSSQAEDANSMLSSGQQELQSEIDRLNKIAKQGKKLDELRKKVEAQAVVFKVLEDGKVGPLNMLMFTSYALQRVDATLPEDEYRVLSRVWAPEKLPSGAPGETEWNPERVWLTGLSESEGEVTIEGEAKDHEDVMTFLKRLRTGIYFEQLDLVEQKRVTKSALTASAPEFETPFIKFTLTGGVNYDPTGYPPL